MFIGVSHTKISIWNHLKRVNMWEVMGENKLSEIKEEVF